MLEIGPNFSFALNDDILLREVGETAQYYAFNLENGDHFSLNETAYVALEMIGPGILFDDLVQKFAVNYNLNETEIIQDVAEIVSVALSNGIVKELGK